MKKAELLKMWAVGMGSMDAVTGLLLIVIPGWVTGMLGVKVPGDAVVFLQWIGVFVMGVGVSYSLAVRNALHGEAVWVMTGWVRLMVCAFLAWQIALGNFELGWGIVALSDGVVGLLQFLMLRLGWWKEGRR